MSRPTRHELFSLLYTVVFLIGIYLIGLSLSNNITIENYTGWMNDCELAGGVAHDGKCFDPSALIKVGE